MLLFIGVLCFCVGIFATLVFQGGETTGRLAQHTRNLLEAWSCSDKATAECDLLRDKLLDERVEHASQYRMHETE